MLVLDIIPILVIVKDSRYDCFSLSATPTEQDFQFIGFLQGMGGVNESVEEGRYYFAVQTVGEHNIPHLYPAPV